MIFKLSIPALIILFSFGCSQDTNKNKAEFMKGCFTTHEIALINEGVVIFEEILKEHYSITNDDEIYRRFLKDYRNMNIPISIFLNTKSLSYIEKIKKTDLFNTIWTNEIRDNAGSTSKAYIEYMAQQEDEEMNETPFYYTNPKGAFLNCIISKNNNAEFSDYLNAVKREPEIAPDFKSSALLRLNKELLGSSPVQVFIVFSFYYESVMTIEGLRKD